jgi:hypothetical protein
VYGDSAAHLPNQVRIKKLDTTAQYKNRNTGEYRDPIKFKSDEEILNKNKNKTENKRPRTPPNLLGIERKIA